MSFVWDHYLDIAESLLKQGISSGDGEAWFRCAISRAYYAAFHEGRVYLKDPEMQHFYVFNKLAADKSRKGKQLFEEFRFLKRNREKADYKIKERFSAEDAEKTIVSAKKFLKLARI